VVDMYHSYLTIFGRGFMNKFWCCDKAAILMYEDTSSQGSYHCVRWSTRG
jgi:hypothetical protein